MENVVKYNIRTHAAKITSEKFQKLNKCDVNSDGILEASVILFVCLFCFLVVLFCFLGRNHNYENKTSPFIFGFQYLNLGSKGILIR